MKMKIACLLVTGAVQQYESKMEQVGGYIRIVLLQPAPTFSEFMSELSPFLLLLSVSLQFRHRGSGSLTSQRIATSEAPLEDT